MKYKTYKTLTAEQKEEYDFRFTRSPVVIDVKSMLWPVMSFFQLFVSIVFLCYICATDEKFIKYKPYVVQWLTSTGAIFQAISWILLIVVVFWFIELIWTGFQEYRFLKKCKEDGQRVSKKPIK